MVRSKSVTRYPRIGWDVIGNKIALRSKEDKMASSNNDNETGTGFPKGVSSAFEVWGGERSPRTYGRYSSITLRECYLKTSTLRATVDRVVREVTTLPWVVVAKNPRTMTKETMEHLARATRFFKNPNANNESLQQLLSKVLLDMLVLDAGCIEKVKSMDGQLMELYARDGATIMPLEDEHGVLQGYDQKVWGRGGQEVVKFGPEELVYLKIYPRSWSPYGIPIVESIIREVAAVLYSMDFIADSFTEDEIPPGILVLGKIGEEAYERAKEGFQKARGQESKQKVRVIDNVDQADWLQLKRGNREQQLAELTKIVDKAIYRAYGVMPIEMGVTDSTPRATAEVQEKMGRVQLLGPLVQILSYFVNTEIIPTMGFDDIVFKFVTAPEVTDQQLARANKELVTSGIASINEVREKYGLIPNPGGDRPFIIVGKRLYFIDQLPTATSESWVQDQQESERREAQEPAIATPPREGQEEA